MSQPELVKRFIGILESIDIGYMLTGSVVSSMQGEPRFSHDIDILVMLNTDQARRLVAALPSDEFYADEDAALNAVRKQHMFNIIPLHEHDKIDVWMLKNEPFDRSRFSRRLTKMPWGFPVKVSTPEDTILSKLRWLNECGGSEKQFRDALRVFELQHGILDENYMNQWAGIIGVSQLLQKIRDEALPI